MFSTFSCFINWDYLNIKAASNYVILWTFFWNFPEFSIFSSFIVTQKVFLLQMNKLRCLIFILKNNNLSDFSTIYQFWFEMSLRISLHPLFRICWRESPSVFFFIFLPSMIFYFYWNNIVMDFEKSPCLCAYAEPHLTRIILFLLKSYCIGLSLPFFFYFGEKVVFYSEYLFLLK